MNICDNTRNKLQRTLQTLKEMYNNKKVLVIEIRNYNAEDKYLGIKHKAETSKALVPKTHPPFKPRIPGNYAEPYRKQREIIAVLVNIWRPRSLAGHLNVLSR